MPISTGAKNGASRPWTRYVTDSISPTEHAAYSSETMRTSSLRLLVDSSRSRYAANSSNRMGETLSDPAGERLADGRDQLVDDRAVRGARLDGEAVHAGVRVP